MSDNELAPYYDDHVPLEIGEDTPEQYAVAEYLDTGLASWEAYFAEYPEGHHITSRGDVGDVIATAESVLDVIAPHTQNFLLSLTDDTGAPLGLHPLVIALAYDLAIELGGGGVVRQRPAAPLHSGSGRMEMIADLTVQQDQAMRDGNVSLAQRLDQEIMRLAGSR